MVRNRATTGSLKCAVGVAQSNYSRGVAQWLARNVRDLEVGGSNPPPPDGARPLKTSQTNEDTSPRHYRRSTGPWDALQYQRAGNSTPRALKRTQGCLRRKLSPPLRRQPPPTNGAVDFLLRVPDHHNLRGRRFSMNHVEGPRTLQHVPQVILRVIARQGCPDAGIQGVPKDGAAGFPATIRLQPMCGDSGRRPDRRK